MRQRLVSWSLVIFGLSFILVQCSRLEESSKDVDACGFSVDQGGTRRLSWKGRVPIPLTVDSDVSDDYLAAFHDAAQAWNEAFGATLFLPPIKIDLVPNSSAQDQRSTLYIWKNANWFGSKDEAARTHEYHYDGKMVECDFYLNSRSTENEKGYDFHSTDNFERKGQTDLRSVLAHELGHCLGLTHNSHKESIMRATIDASDKDAKFRMRRVPGQIDINNLKCEY